MLRGLDHGKVGVDQSDVLADEADPYGLGCSLDPFDETLPLPKVRP